MNLYEKRKNKEGLGSVIKRVLMNLNNNKNKVEGLDCVPVMYPAAKNLEIQSEIKLKKRIKIKTKSANQGPSVVTSVSR